ncbi:MAG: PilZ domain-containing protein [Parvularculaceae bacterium]
MAKHDEFRRYRRITIDLPARIVVNGIDEYKGRLLNISPGDMAIMVDAAVAVGDTVVIHVNGLDVIEGRVVRIFPDGFAISFLLSRRRRAQLTEQLAMRANPAFAEGLADRRGTPRHAAGDQRTVCRLADGTSLFVRVIDMSVDGVSVDAPRKPPVGSIIHVGRRRGVIVRHTPRGFVVVYEPAAAPPQSNLRAV